jgi:hypothetical protein
MYLRGESKTKPDSVIFSFQGNFKGHMTYFFFRGGFLLYHWGKGSPCLDHVRATTAVGLQSTSGTPSKISTVWTKKQDMCKPSPGIAPVCHRNLRFFSLGRGVIEDVLYKNSKS